MLRHVQKLKRTRACLKLQLLLFGLPGPRVINVAQHDDRTRIVNTVAHDEVAGAHPKCSVFSTARTQRRGPHGITSPTVMIESFSLEQNPLAMQ